MRTLSSVALLLLWTLPTARAQVDVEIAFPSLSFDRPVDLQHAGDGTDRLFVAEQHQGRIRVFENDPASTTSSIFLDIGDRLSRGNEEGLLGFAFHPDYATNGHVFVYYSASTPRRSVVARFTVDPADPDAADLASELPILTISQPYSNHNGGQLVFGPDGYLYIALGDGGDAGDPDENGQDRTTLLGSILRIDVDQASAAEPYRIPTDNPYAGNAEGYREEIFAYGLRNPWRMSIDPETGRIWAGDVGQGSREEINIIEKGKNYGWDIKEGTRDFEPDASVPPDSLVDPVWEYGRDLGSSVSGGHVYRGSRVPELVGRYIFADYVSRRIWALDGTGEELAEVDQLVQASFNIPGFGVDERGELYVLGFDGHIYQFRSPQSTAREDADRPVRFALDAGYPNPFDGSTTIPFFLDDPGRATLVVYDMLGRRVRTLVDAALPAGRHTAVWDGRDTGSRPVSDGAYLLRLRVDDAYAESRLSVRRR